MLSPQAKSMPLSRRSTTPNWRDIYFAAVLESDEMRALIRIQSARRVLRDRLLELQAVANSPIEELRDLQSALTYLDILFACIREDDPGSHMAAIA